MCDAESPTLEERIAQIQLNAYANLNISPPEIEGLFKREKLRIIKFSKARPNYIKSSIEAENAAEHFIEPNLAKRFDIKVPTPFQEPFVYSWLNDVWQSHKHLVYNPPSSATNNIVLATAPTGRFNALAIPGDKKNGIIIEDGLMRFARQFSILLAPLLYHCRNGEISYINGGKELSSHLASNENFIERLIDITADYLEDGYIESLKPYETDQGEGYENRVADSLFSGFITFVIEHELHHLLARPSGRHITLNIEDGFDDLWQIFLDKIVPFVENPIDKNEVRQIFEDHQEEILADFRAVNLVFAASRARRQIWPTLDGILVFFHVIELFRWAMLKISDPERLEQEAKLDGTWLSIAAILYQESHPYPLMRRASVLSMIRNNDEPFSSILIERETRFIQVFNAIRERFRKRLVTTSSPDHVNQKWTISSKELVGGM